MPDVPEAPSRIRVSGTGGPVNGINVSFTLKLLAQSSHMRPGHVLQKSEPSALCTRRGSDN